jgi:hypothetical protein
MMLPLSATRGQAAARAWSPKTGNSAGTLDTGTVTMLPAMSDINMNDG